MHKEKGASCVLACAKLKESELAEFIKNVEGVSKVFNIVINPSDTKNNGRILNLCKLDIFLNITRNIFHLYINNVLKYKLILVFFLLNE